MEVRHEASKLLHVASLEHVVTRRRRDEADVAALPSGRAGDLVGALLDGDVLCAMYLAVSCAEAGSYTLHVIYLAGRWWCVQIDVALRI